MKIFVTGASGFIGRRLVNALSLEGHDVSVLTRRSGCLFPKGVRAVSGDLTSVDYSFDQLLDGCEVVYHCAGEIQNETEMRALHVDGTQRLLQATQRAAQQKRRAIHWVQLSSVGAYGPPQGAANVERTVTEDTPTQPFGEYEMTKTESDALVVKASENGLISYSIVRPSNVFGADMSNNSLRSLGGMIRRGVFFYIGRPGAIATYVHVDDVVEVLRICGSDIRAKGKIFNISNDCFLEEMIEGIATSLMVKCPRLRFPEPFIRLVSRITSKFPKNPLSQKRIDALVSRTRYPSHKLARELGFCPRMFVPNAISEAVLMV